MEHRRLTNMNKFLPVLQVSQQLYRSPQPDFEDVLSLKSRGVGTIINLREEATESEFFAKQCGMQYLYLPVVDWELPSASQVATFLRFLEQGEDLPVLIHCAAGVGRTGTFVACYRIAQGMDIEEALRRTNGESPLSGVVMNPLQQNFVRTFQPPSSSDA